MTYRELFNHTLEEQIAVGGDVGRIVTLVNVYQGTDQVARHSVFREWLDSASLPCARCRVASKLMVVEDIEEDDQVLCDWCRRGALGIGLEPAPGFTRAFAR